MFTVSRSEFLRWTSQRSTSYLAEDFLNYTSTELN